MNQPVHDGIGDRRIIHQLMPLGGGDLTGDEGGVNAVTILEDFQEITLLGIGDFGKW